MRRSIPRDKRRQYLYRVFSADGELVYIGCTVHFRNRISGHKSAGLWWQDGYTAEVFATYEDKRTALDAESDAIYRYQPRHNIMWRSRNIPEHEVKDLLTRAQCGWAPGLVSA